MTGSSQPNYFYLPYESRPQIDRSDLAFAQGGSPPWQLTPSYPSPPMSSPPSPQRKVSDIQPPPATTFSELTLSATTTSSDPSTTRTDFDKPPVSAGARVSTLQNVPQSSAPTPVATSSGPPRTYSSSSTESVALLRQTESGSSASNVPDPLPTAGPSILQSSSDIGRGGRRAKAHVANACNNCKRAHLSCDVERPCGRCVATGKADTCRDVPHKKRGRPRLRDEAQFHLQQGGSEIEAVESPVPGPSSARPMARPGHRKTASLRTLAAFASEQGHQPSTGQGVSTRERAYSFGAAPQTGLPPPSRHPRLAPSPEVPIAFLDTDFVVLKANATFQRLFSWLQEIKGIRLSDIAKPLEGDSFQNARNRLREEREIREPAYLPPILQPRLDPVSGIGTTDHDVEEVTRGFADHQFNWTFRLGGGVDQTLPVRMRLAKTSVYFVTLFLPPLPPQVAEQVIVPQPPPVMFPTRVAAVPLAPFQGSPQLMEQQPGISEPPSTYYILPAGDPGSQNYTLNPRYTFGEHSYTHSTHYQPTYHQQQHQHSAQQMLPPPPTLSQSSDQRPGTAGSSSSSHMSQPSFLQPPLHGRSSRPRSDTMDSLGRHIQTRLRADSGATVPVFHSSPVQQRHATERAWEDTVNTKASYRTSPSGGSIHSPASSHQQQSVTSQPQTSVQRSVSLEDSGSAWSFPTTDVEPDPTAALYPDGDEEFEWDEREQTGLAGGVAMAEDDEEGVRKVMDGMATLTVDAANYGYLGMASGASHLRSLWMESGNGPSWDSGAWNDRRRDLQDLLRRRTEGSTIASAVQTQTLVTRAMVDVFVDAFFVRYHPVFPILHEPTFRAQYDSRMTRPGQSIWLVLVNIVAALGAFVTNPSSSDETSLSIFRTAKRYLAVNALETGNLTLVQAFGMAAMFLQKINKPNTGYNYGGVAIRMAIGLGLHKEFGSQHMSPFKQELRRRIWWSLCVLDVGATITYSRPLIWPQIGVDAALPSNIREEDIMVNSPVTPAEVDTATVNTYLRVQSSYHLQTMPIYNRLISNPPPLPEELLTLDSTIVEAWLSQVPHYFQDSSGPNLEDRFALPHGINCWRYRNLRIVIFRPLLVKWALQDGLEETLTWHEQEATNRCLRAARESIASIQNFWKSRPQTRLTAFYVLYFLFQAALIPIHCLRSKSQSRLAPEWRDQVTATLEVVESMIGLNQSASKCRDVIISLCGSLLRSVDDEFVNYEQAFNFEPTMDATQWISGCAPVLINENLWAGSLDNTSAELSFSTWEGDWNI
ncbi:hypothetical protein KCU98_g9062, partial [Aureobasidium melanogenum]